MVESKFNPILQNLGNRKANYKSRTAKMQNSSDLLSSILSKIAPEQKLLIIKLWQNWSMVMGEELCELLFPLGSKKRSRGQVLLIGVEDALLMQDMTYEIPEILERANAFMGEEYFIDVELGLLLNKKIMTIGETSFIEPQKIIYETPKTLGNLCLDGDDAVSRAYNAYVKFFKK